MLVSGLPVSSRVIGLRVCARLVLVSLRRTSLALKGVCGEDGDLGDTFYAWLDDCYARRGWDRTTGCPTRETLEALDLGEVARSL